MAGPEREIQTLVGLLNAAVAKEKRDLLNYKRDGAWHPIAASELAEKVRATAMGLEALGVRAGDHVGLLSENRPEWTMADLGILNCAAADVPIHTTQAEAQVHYILNDAGVRVMFISGQTQYNRVREALNDMPKLRTIIAFDRIEADDERLISFDELQNAGARQTQLNRTFTKRCGAACDPTIWQH